MAPPKLRSNNRHVPVLALDTVGSHTYRSNHNTQQVRFPSRRKVVRRYGRHEAVLSPKQRTLTQIAYAVPPSPGLRETDFLDLEQEQETDVSSNSRPNRENNASRLPPRKNQNKRRKTHHTAANSTTSNTTSYHTQTLTQLVPKNTLPDPDFEDNDDFVLGAMIQDSEDDDIPVSPSLGAYPNRSSMSLRQQAGPDGINGTTPLKPRADAWKAPPSPLLRTPKTTRTEIPSSQPSPFTPMWRLYSPRGQVGCQHPSPASYRRLNIASPTSPSPGSQTLPTKSISADSPTGPSCGLREGGREREGASGEIPDSDEEESGLSDPYSPKQSMAPVTHAVRQLSDQYYGDDGGLLSSLPLSRPPSPDAEPALPLPDPQKSQASGAGTPSWTADETPYVPTDGTTAPTTRNLSLRQQKDTHTRSRVLDQQYEELPANSQQEPTMPVDTQQQSQALESQRVPLETIRTLGPQTDRSDIIISIHPEQIRKIVSGTKDHEFRNFKVPHTVSRFWMYATRPACELQYMAVVAAGFRQPGDIDSNSGIGNAEFNAGKLVARYAYKLVQVYQLNNPVSLDTMQKNGWAGAPRRYDYLPPAIVGCLLGNLRCALFEESSRPGIGSDDDGCEGKDDDRAKYIEVSVSQEIEAQLFSDIAETQQKYQSSLLPSSQGHSMVSRLYLPQEPVAPHASAPSFNPRETQVRGDARLPVTSGATWISQATTASTELTQERLSEHLPRLYSIDATAARASSLPDDQTATTSRSALEPDLPTVRPARYQTGEAQGSCADTRPRMGLASELASVGGTSQEQRPRRTSQKKLRVRRPRLSLHAVTVSSSDSTQAALPDSLYEEVRQAPPVVIVDSEESDGA